MNQENNNEQEGVSKHTHKAYTNILCEEHDGILRVFDQCFYKCQQHISCGQYTDKTVSLENQIKDTEIKEYRKEICKHCRGKGYSTNFHGITGADDFGGDGWKEPMKMHVYYCDCERGKALKQIIDKKQDEAKLEILKKVYNALKRKNSITLAEMTKVIRGYWYTIQKQ